MEPVPRRIRLSVGCAPLLACLAASLGAADPPLRPILERGIIGRDVPLSEVRAYAEARVAPMPEVRSAAEWSACAEALREEVLSRVVFRGEAAAWRDAQTRVEWAGAIDGGPGYRIRKLRYEALPGLWIPALLYEPEGIAGKKVPAILDVNGHDGKGKAAPYKQIRCINQAKRGILALNVEWLGMGQLATPGFRHGRMNQLDLCGTSGLAPFWLAMARAIDLLLAHPNADPERLGVAGLSGGGWQTIFLSALDPRIALSNPVAGYSSFRTRARVPSDLGDSEQTPVDLASIADYTHLTAMRAPRPTLLTYNAKDDCCFAAGHALPPLLEAAGPIFELFGRGDRLRWHINEDPGTHNFDRENREALYRMIGDAFFPGEAAWRAAEIPSEGEVKTAKELEVELPAGNLDFHGLALALAAKLPRDPEIPEEIEAREAWARARRKLLAEIVRARSWRVEALPRERIDVEGGRATCWSLSIGEAWTVPAVEIARGEPKGTAILIADAGRAGAGAEAERLLGAGSRVLAVDPFYFGESAIRDRAYLYALLISSIGDRPLGIQASQIAAIARWLSTERGADPVTLVAEGPRTGLIALVAAALEERAIGALEIRGGLASLGEIIEKDWTVEERPELFCFGLLERFDIPQLAALVAPRPFLSR